MMRGGRAARHGKKRPALLLQESAGVIQMLFLRLICNKLLATLAAAIPWLCAAAPSCAQESAARDRDVHRVIGLLDYLSTDYAGAVQNGTVVNAEEYQEQLAIADEAMSLAGELEAAGGRNLSPLLRAVQQQIQQKVASVLLQPTLRAARKRLLDEFDVRLSPDGPPSFERGKQLYTQNCLICHGERGDANTQRARELKPPPLSYLSAKGREAISPYHVFNVVTFGVQGTAMASFDLIPARDRWDIAFYVAALRHLEYKEKNPDAKLGEGGPAPQGLPALSLSELASSSDAALEARLEQLERPPSQREGDIAWLRYHVFEAPVVRTGGLAQARSGVAQIVELYRNGKTSEARSSAFDVYLRHVEPIEAELRALDAPTVTRIEAGFVELRAAIKEGMPAARISRIAEDLDRDFVTAETILLKGRGSATLSFFASMLIIVREGIEAMLVIAAILGLLRKVGQPGAVRSVHYGWILALACGGVTWLAARAVIQVSAAERELVEGAVGLLAAGMLAYTSYWILSRADTKRWLEFLKAQVSQALSRRGRTALFGIAFLAVYREAFETVLFYEALLKESGANVAAVGFGALAGAAALGVAMVAIFRISARLPLRQFFAISGGLLYLLAFVFAGNAIHAFIEGGYLDPRPLPMPRVEWLGLYPDLVGVSLQAGFVLAVALGLWCEFKTRAGEAARVRK
jgi:high-affinity iron transporter